MKIQSILFSLVVSFSLVACGSSAPKEDEGDTNAESVTETAQEELSDTQQNLLNMPLESEEAIEDWIADLAMETNRQSIPVSEYKTVQVDGKNMEVRIVNPGGKVTIVSAAHPQWQAPTEAYRYYTRNDEVIALEKFVRKEDVYELDMVYYADGQILSSNTRTGATLEEARQAIPGTFVPEEGDTYDDYAQIKAVAKEIRDVFQGS
jgi:hypothetical protein